MDAEYKYLEFQVEHPQNPLETAGIHPLAAHEYSDEIALELATRFLRALFSVKHPDRASAESAATSDASDLSELVSIFRSDVVHHHLAELRLDSRAFFDRLEDITKRLASIESVAVDSENAFVAMLTAGVFPDRNSLWDSRPREFTLLPLGVRTKLSTDPSEAMMHAAAQEELRYDSIPESVRAELRREVEHDFQLSEGFQLLSRAVTKQLKKELPALHKKYIANKASASESAQYETRSREIEAEKLHLFLPESKVQERVLERYGRARSFFESSRGGHNDEEDLLPQNDFAAAAEREAERHAQKFIIRDGQIVSGTRTATIIGVCVANAQFLNDVLPKIETSDERDLGRYGLPISTLSALMPNLDGSLHSHLMNRAGWTEGDFDNQYLVSISRSEKSDQRISLNIEGEIHAVRDVDEPARVKRAKR